MLWMIRLIMPWVWNLGMAWARVSVTLFSVKVSVRLASSCVVAPPTSWQLRVVVRIRGTLDIPVLVPVSWLNVVPLSGARVVVLVLARALVEMVWFSLAVECRILVTSRSWSLLLVTVLVGTRFLMVCVMTVGRVST